MKAIRAITDGMDSAQAVSERAARAARRRGAAATENAGGATRVHANERVRANAGRVEPADPTRRLVGAFVGQAFYGVLMKQMQESTLKTGLMHGGRGEEVFSQQLGMELAARMGRSANDPVAERMHRSFQKHLRARGGRLDGPDARGGRVEEVGP